MPSKDTISTSELLGEKETISTAELFGLGDIKPLDVPKSTDYTFMPVPYAKERSKFYKDYIENRETDLDSITDKFGTVDAFVDRDDKAGAINAAYFADVSGMQIEQTYDLQDEFSEMMFGAKYTPEKLLDRVKNRYHNGNIQVKIMDEGYNLLTGADKEITLNKIKQLRGQLNGNYANDFRGEFEKMIGGTAEQIPILREGMLAGGKGAAIGGSIGILTALMLGQLGPQAALPEEAVTVPMAGKLGIKVGGGIMAADRIRKLEGGGAFLEFMDIEDEYGNKLDPTIAAIAAHSVGAINGVIELAEWAVLLETFGIGTKVFDNAAEKVTAKLLAKGSLKQIVAKYALKYGASMTAEVAQELEQETSNILFGELAKTINNDMKGTDFKHITPEALKERYYETATESLRSFALLLAPGTIIKGGLEVSTRNITDTVKGKIGEKPDSPKLVYTEDLKEGVGEGLAVETTPKIDSESTNSQDTTITTPTEENGLESKQGVQEVETVPELEEPVTVEEQSALEQVSADVKAEDAEIVSPNLYIGNVTRRMKKKFSKIFDRLSEEVKGFVEKGFPTKRTNIEMTKGEARAYLSFLEEDLNERLDSNKIRTENDLAQANADWGDITTLREALGIEKGKAPFHVTRAGKHKMVVEKNTKTRIYQAISPSERSKMTVGQVLSNTVKRMAQAARTAYSVGKSEGIAKVKQQYREMKARNKAKKQLYKYVQKLVKNVLKNPSKNMDLFYQQAIEFLQSTIDPKTRNNKTKKRMESQREFLKRSTPEQLESFPRKLYDKLFAKNIEDFTIMELEQLDKQIATLRKLGKTKFTAKKAIEKARFDKDKKKILETTGQAPSIDDKAPVAGNRDKTKIKDIPKVAWLWSLRPQRIFDWLDGMKGTFDGVFHELFYDNANEAYNQSLKEQKRRKESLTKRQEELGITDVELATEVSFKELGMEENLLIEQMMGIYLAIKNNLSLAALEYGNNISLKMAKAIISNLDQKYKDMADYIMEDYDREYSRIREAHIDQTNQDMGHEKNYTPIIRMDINNTVSVDEIEKQLNGRMGLRKAYASKTFAKDRKKNIPAEYQQPMSLRVVSNWYNQMKKQEHYVAHAKPLKQMRRLLADKQIQKAIKSKLGSAGLDIVNKWVDRVANNNIYKAQNGLEQGSRIARGNIAIAYLAYNALTMLKQAPSIALYIKDAGIENMVSSAIEFSLNPKKYWSLVREKSLQVGNAFIEREISELKSVSDYHGNKAIKALVDLRKKVGQAGMVGIGVMDGVVRTIGWMAVYNNGMQSGLGEAAAVKEADNSTLRTQPAAHAKDLAQLYTTNEFVNWFTMFSNQLNQIWNIGTYDTFAYWNDKNYQAVAKTQLGLAINAMAIWMITNKRLPDGEDDLKEMASEQYLNSIPFAGKIITSTQKGYGSFDFAPVEFFADVTRIQKAKNKKKAMLQAIKTGASLSGLPTVAADRATKFLKSGKPVELIGGSPKRSKFAR